MDISGRFHKVKQEGDVLVVATLGALWTRDLTTDQLEYIRAFYHFDGIASFVDDYPGIQCRGNYNDFIVFTKETKAESEWNGYSATTVRITDKNGKAIEINPGDLFKSKNCLGYEYTYRYLGIVPDGCGYDYYLHDEASGQFSNVELAWFTQRKITLIG